MANNSSEEIKLVFTIEDVWEQDIPNNIINLWVYNYVTNHLPCRACAIYRGFCETILREQWCPDYGNVDFVIEKIKNCDKNFINIMNFSSATKHKIIDILIEKNKKN